MSAAASSSSPSMDTARASVSRTVTNLLLNLRGEHYRRGLNEHRLRAAQVITLETRGPSLPPLVPIQTLPSRIIIPSSSALAKRPAAGPPPPESWTTHDEQASNAGFDRDSREWRAFALEPVLVRLSVPPPRTDTLVHMCLQQIIELAPELLPELPLHMQRHALLYTAVAAPLPGAVLQDIIAAGGGEALLARSYGTLFLQRTGVLEAPTSATFDGSWDDEDAETKEDDAQPLHTLVVLDSLLPVSILSRLPASLTHLALLAIPTPLASIHRLPGLLPHLILLDLSFNPWLNDGTLNRIQWERWRGLRAVGLRVCALVNEPAAMERIQHGRVQDVEVYF